MSVPFYVFMAKRGFQKKVLCEYIVFSRLLLCVYFFWELNDLQRAEATRFMKHSYLTHKLQCLCRNIQTVAKHKTR